MLPKEYRLKKKSAFTATYRVKNSIHKSGITLFCGIEKKDNTLPTKIGFVVSKKTHKRAVKRNRLKRLMRESIRLILKSGNINNHNKYMSLIFIGGEHALSKNFTDINSTIQTLLEKI